MANDTWTAPSGPSAGTIGRAEMETQRTDNINVLALAVDGDLSTTTIKHRHLTDTLANRPAAGESGRIFRATDTKQVFMDDGTNWYQIGGGPIYDTFNRSAGSDLGNADSGQAWTEMLGNLEIFGSAMRAVATGVAVVDAGSLLDRYVRIQIGIITGAVQNNISEGIVIRYLDSDNYLYVTMSGFSDLLDLRKVDGGVDTSIASEAFVPATTTSYFMTAEVHGPIVMVRIERFNLVTMMMVRHDQAGNTLTPFSGATMVGVRIVPTAADTIGDFSAEVRG